MRTFEKLWSEETGLVLSAELVLVLTIGVLAMVVGLNAVASSLNQELNDIAGAFGAIDQTYAYSGFVNPLGYGSAFGAVGTCGSHSFVRGSGYIDAADACDCSEIVPVGGAVKGDGGTGSEAGTSVAPAAASSNGVATSNADSSVAPIEVETDEGCTTCNQ